MTPELPDNTLTTSEKLNLDFEILSDIDNKFAKELGIVFSLRDDLKELYAGFGIDLEGTQGNDNFELPLPGTFVVGQDGKVLLAHMDEDYTTRMEPEAVLDVL